MPDPEQSDIHLTMHTRQGSFQHYHHFLLGFLVPLVAAWDDLAGSRVFVRSCAVMDPLLHQLRLPELVVLPATAHDAMVLEAPGRRIVLEGRDWPCRYDASTFQKVRGWIFGRLAPGIKRARHDLDARFTGTGERILLIRRDPPDPFYASAASEAKTAGAQRRSIANFDALAEFLGAHTDNLLVTALDGLTLAEQVAAFAWAEIIVAQHGAALSNLLWAKAGTRIIEIVPRELEQSLASDDFFGALAACLGLPSRRVWQANAHGPVDVQALSTALLFETENL